jgi:POT family proton-dependent oligopeptide transporter
MGLALVSKLSPRRVTGLMMGGWFLATALGNKLSGVLSGLWGSIEHKVYFFGINFVGAMFGALLIFIMLKWLKRVVLEHTGSR